HAEVLNKWLGSMGLKPLYPNRWLGAKRELNPIDCIELCIWKQQSEPVSGPDCCPITTTSLLLGCGVLAGSSILAHAVLLGSRVFGHAVLAHAVLRGRVLGGFVLRCLLLGLPLLMLRGLVGGRRGVFLRVALRRRSRCGSGRRRSRRLRGRGE